MAHNILLRPARNTDVPLITSSWLQSFRGSDAKGKKRFRRGGYFQEGVPNRFYYYYHQKVLETIVPNSIVLVACLEESPDTILGWCCAQVVDTALIFHYVYVKGGFRKFGIAKRLVNALLESEKPPAVFVSHLVPTLKGRIKDMGWMYNPYLLFMKLPLGWQNSVGTKPQGA